MNNFKVTLGAFYEGEDVHGKWVNGVIEKDLVNTFILLSPDFERYIISKKCVLEKLNHSEIQRN